MVEASASNVREWSAMHRCCSLLTLSAVWLLSAAAAQAQTVQTLYAGPFDQPRALTVDGSGNLYAASFANQTLVKSTATGAANVLATIAALPQASSIAADQGGDVFVIDTQNAIDKVAPDGTVTGFVGAAQGIGQPQGLAVDSVGNLYVADTAPVAVHKVAPDGTVTTLLTAAQGLVHPQALAFDAAGDLFIGDQADNTIDIWKLPPSGTIASLASIPGTVGT